MLAISFLEWWYAQGWGIFASGLAQRLKSSADFFSLKLLIRTLFSPFRQISATSTGPGQIIDRLISRAIGFIVRLGLMLFGAVLIIIETVVGLALLIIWPLVPAAPIICIVLGALHVQL